MYFYSFSQIGNNWVFVSLFFRIINMSSLISYISRCSLALRYQYMFYLWALHLFCNFGEASPRGPPLGIVKPPSKAEKTQQHRSQAKEKGMRPKIWKYEKRRFERGKTFCGQEKDFLLLIQPVPEVLAKKVRARCKKERGGGKKKWENENETKKRHISPYVVRGLGNSRWMSRSEPDLHSLLR